MDDEHLFDDCLKLEHAVENVLVENNLETVLYFSKIVKYWNVVVGEPLAKKTHPSQLKGKTLFVTVADAAYSHHLKYYEKPICDLIASPEICGVGVVNKIIFRVGPTSNKKGVSSHSSSSNQASSPEISKEILDRSEVIGKTISHAELKKAFERFMSKSLAQTPEDK